MWKWSVDGLLPLTPGTSYTFRLATAQPWQQWRWGNLVGLPCTTEAQDIVSTLFRWAPVDSYISSPSPPFLPLLLGSSHDKLADSLCHPGPRQIARSWTLCHSRLARRLSVSARTAGPRLYMASARTLSVPTDPLPMSCKTAAYGIDIGTWMAPVSEDTSQ